MALPEQGPKNGGYENVPVSPLTQRIDKTFRSISRDLRTLEIGAERAAFLSEPADNLVSRLKEGGHGAPIVYEGITTEGKPIRKIGGYILALDGASLIFFRNGQVFRGEKNTSPGFSQEEYETNFHKNEIVKPAEDLFFDGDGMLTDIAVRDTMLYLSVQGMVVTHSNDNPDQRIPLKQMVTQRLKLVDKVEERTLPDVDRAGRVIMGYIDRDLIEAAATVEEFDLFMANVEPTDFLPPDNDVR